MSELFRGMAASSRYRVVGVVVQGIPTAEGILLRRGILIVPPTIPKAPYTFNTCTTPVVDIFTLACPSIALP